MAIAEPPTVVLDAEAPAEHTRRNLVRSQPLAHLPIEALDIAGLTGRFRVLQGEFSAVGHKSLDLAYSIGEVLERVRATVGKGKWLGWCDNEDLEGRTAQRYIKFREKVGDRERLADLPRDCSMRGAMAFLTEDKLPGPQVPETVFPVATPADVTLEVLDAGRELPNRIVRAIRRSRSEGVDLVVTSWPYCLGVSVSDFGYVDTASYDQWLEAASNWAATLYMVAAPNGRVVLNVPIDIHKDQPKPRPIAHDALSILEAAGFHYRASIVWIKAENGHNSNTVARGSVRSPNAPTLATGDELVLVVHKGEWNLARPSEANDLPKDAIQWTNAHWVIPGERDPQYPHVLPKTLVARLIKLFSYPGDLVADFHCGRGTVAVEALRSGRPFAGGDLNPYAVALSTRNVEAAWAATASARE